MQVHVRKYGAELELDDTDTYAQDDEIAAMFAELPLLERAVASRPMRGLSPILDADDEDYEDFDLSSFAGRTYQ
jgi:hypothetical protein